MRQVQRLQQVRLARRQREHRRDGGDHFAVKAGRSLKVSARRELAQHHDRAAGNADQQALDQGVHMVKRGGDERALALEGRRRSGQHINDPDIAPVS